MIYVIALIITFVLITLNSFVKNPYEKARNNATIINRIKLFAKRVGNALKSGFHALFFILRVVSTGIAGRTQTTSRYRYKGAQ